jgi:hypothetical protein
VRPGTDTWFSISCESYRIGISKMSDFPGFHNCCERGPDSIAIMDDSGIALANGSICALLRWLEANAARSTVATEITKSSPLRYKTR